MSGNNYDESPDHKAGDESEYNDGGSELDDFESDSEELRKQTFGLFACELSKVHGNESVSVSVDPVNKKIVDKLVEHSENPEIEETGGSVSECASLRSVSDSGPALTLDIGIVIKPSMTTSEVLTAVEKLPTLQKYKLNIINQGTIFLSQRHSTMAARGLFSIDGLKSTTGWFTVEL